MEKERQVSYEEGKDFADKFNLVFYETSAKTSENIKEIFISITKELIIKNSRSERLFVRSIYFNPRRLHSTKKI
jgi:hypothetical protein